VAVIVPEPPVAKQEEIEGQLMPLRMFVVLGFCCDQLAPPSVVATIAPVASSGPPTAKQVEALGQLMAANPAEPAGVVCPVHVAPPSVVVKMLM
jgi:hypothetical protein